jgi:threonylcarbamoyladenosine tRNA methylthiotransferase MtaB
MRRRYNASQYRDAVQRLREAVPDVAITTDVIVGFPGETETEFEESLAFCAEMSFAAVHVFPYSQRNHTLAARLPDPVAEPVKKQRVHGLIDLAASMSQAYRSRFLGRTMPVLWENQRDGLWEGLTDTYVRVRTAIAADLRNRLTPALITAQDGETLRANLMENPHE